MATNETVEVVETEEIIDGKIRKVRRTIRRNVTEEVELLPEPDPKPELEAVETVETTETTYIYDNVTLTGGAVKDDEQASVDSAEAAVEETGPELECRCFSPSGKVAQGALTDNEDGTFTIDINASEPGVHTVEIEMNGEKIPGSPFLVRIVQAADKRKVRIHGPGLESGLLENFQGLFHVDNKGAGPGDLKVRIKGPKEKFKIDMFRAHPNDRIINVNYNPEEVGVYQVSVYWSGEHVNGSPCEFFLAKDIEQLRLWEEDQEKIKEIEGLF